MKDASARSRILVVDDDPSLRDIVKLTLESAGYDVSLATDMESALRALEATLTDAVLLDVHLEEESGIAVLRMVRALQGDVPVIMLSGDSEVNTVVEAVQEGAFDYLTKPLDQRKLLTTVRNALQQSAMVQRMRELERKAGLISYAGLIGQSDQMQELYRKLDRLVPVDITVLIQGESGTGKDLIARALHERSSRKDGPFVAINCASIPESLQESELFGHEKGSFTGANARREGRFEQAQGGTLFLDEVAELTPQLQATLLRVLQERKFYRVGGNKQIETDVRILSATHRDLLQAIQGGAFREDLYYRLSVFELWVPPLRDRHGDVLLLANSFLDKMAREMGREPPMLTPEAQACLEAHDWPGNVRELRNAMERALVLCAGEDIGVQDLPRRISLAGPSATNGEPAGVIRGPNMPEVGGGEDGLLPMEVVEKQAIKQALEAANGNVSEVIRILGIPRTTMYRKLRYYGLRE